MSWLLETLENIRNIRTQSLLKNQEIITKHYNNCTDAKEEKVCVLQSLIK